MPSSWGMRMSMSTTSGWWASTAPQHLAAVVGLADHLDALGAGEHHPEARAHERVVVDEQDADRCRVTRGHGQRRAQDEVALGVRAVLEPAAGERDALGEPDQSGPRAGERVRRRSGRPPRAGDDLDDELAPRPAVERRPRPQRPARACARSSAPPARRGRRSGRAAAGSAASPGTSIVPATCIPAGRDSSTRAGSSASVGCGGSGAPRACPRAARRSPRAAPPAPRARSRG